MKRFVLLFSFVGLVAFSRTGLAQPVVSFDVVPQPASGLTCGATNVVPADTAGFEIPLHLLLSSDTQVSGFTVSLRVFADAAANVRVVRDTAIRKPQFIDLHFPVPPEPSIAGNEIGDPFVPFPVDPTKDPGDGPLAGGPQGPGYTLGVVYFIGLNPDTFMPLAISLPPGDDLIVDESVRIVVDTPAAGAQITVEARFEDGLSGLGAPTSNIATINQASVPPAKGSCVMTLEGATGPPRGPIDVSIEGSSAKTTNGSISVPVGQKGSASVQVIMDDNIDDTEADVTSGVEGWQISISYSDSVNVTGTSISADVLGAIENGDGGVDFNVMSFSVFDDGGNFVTGVDPTMVFEESTPADPECELTPGAAQGKGIAGGVVINTGDPMGQIIQVPGDFNGAILDIDLELASPIAEGETVEASFDFVNCVEGEGAQIKTGFTVEGKTRRPRNRTGRTLSFEALAGINYSRGDPNQDGIRDMADVMFIIGYLYFGEAAPACLDEADTNNDDKRDVADVVYLISAEMNLRGDGPAIPGPTSCEDDPDDTATEESCADTACD